MNDAGPAPVLDPPGGEPARMTTQLPPWVLPGAVAGSCRQQRELPSTLGAALRQVGTDFAMLERLVLTSWIAVLSRCVGEPEVSTAVADADGSLSCVTGLVEGMSWADLGRALHRSPLDGRADSAVDVRGAALPETVHLLIQLDPAHGLLSIAYDTAHVSHQAADRVRGYLIYAISAAVSIPAGPVDLAGMLDDAERRHQLEHLCGPRVSNGPDGFVPAFRAQAMARPDQPAVCHHQQALSYAELDRASERIARHLRSHAMPASRAVAVVSSRHLNWVAAMLGVLKAGAIYLPVRPDFPASRVEDQLHQAECAIALTDADGKELMDAVAELASWQGTVLAIDDLIGQEPAEADLPSPGLAEPAYVYFTSGSTGRPKGAMCAHAGLINHLWAKVDDHQLGPGDVVTQTASQCFDISMWQVCAPLLVGGRSVILDIHEQLDVAAFAAALVWHRVTTIQIVPSYLEVLLAHLEAGSVQLPTLTSVSVTGEALKADLVRRWFAAMPGVRLVNAYGATEVSDDTMHEVLDGPPARDLPVVNVGRPLRNVRVYVVDDQQRLMPEGARGEIVFAGVCVGGGYINDPGRTAEAFGSDPYYPGERLYRSGDFGRWLPERRLEFLGRRDDQIKIRGLRVELGDIEAALLRIPGISAAAVVPAGEGNGARLIGFYVSDYELASIDVHDLLSARLPAYMIPAHHFRLTELPLNENGKTNRRRLKEIASELTVGLRAFEPPLSAAEQHLATLWAEVLGMPAGRIGLHDNFFDLGGTSLSAIHLLIRLEHQLSQGDVLSYPVLCDQARMLEKVGQLEQAVLLHELGGPAPGLPVLVCLPDAGGSAINFQHLADVAADRVRVLAVELPGHDLARPGEDLVSLQMLAQRLARGLEGRPDLYLWGQGAGAAAALAAAQALHRAGTPVAGVMVAWDDMVPGSGGCAPPGDLSDNHVADQLRRRQAYVEVDGAVNGRLAFVARAYRHDWAEALRTLEALSGSRGLDCPIIEFLLGTAPPRLDAVGSRVSYRRLLGTGGDLARHHPHQIVQVLDQWRSRDASLA